MTIDRGSPIVMGSLRGLPTVLGSEPVGPSFHDVKALSASNADAFIYTARDRMATKKSPRREVFYAVKAAEMLP